MADRKLTLMTWLSLITLCLTSRYRDELINDSNIYQLFRNLVVDSLGGQEFQSHIAKQHFNLSPLDGQALLDKFLSTTSAQLSDIVGATRRTKKVLEELYKNDTGFQKGLSTHNASQCCMTQENTLIMSSQFKTMIDTNQLCTRFSKDAEEDSLVPLSPHLLDVMKNNRFYNNAIKWQYFGTEEGTFAKYPRQKDDKCDTYDPRYRPWYAETAVNSPKDIVVVFDRSQSIEVKGLLPIVKHSAVALLNTLNAADRIAMVAFNEEISRPPKSCFYNELAFATPDNKKYLTEWLNDIKGRDTSNYRQALLAAFDYFSISADVMNDPRQRNRVLVFLSDGEQDWAPTDDAVILKLIGQRNAELNNTVLIATFGIGPEISAKAIELLRNMSLQTYADISKGPVKRGEFVRLESSENLRAKVGSYYRTLIDDTDNSVVLTTPYVDFSGLGLVMSVCSAVNVGDKLRGVTCCDVSLTEITAEITGLHHGLNSYAFMFDYKYTTFTHPLMPDALTYGSVLYVDIRDIEKDPEALKVLYKAKSGVSGTESSIKRFVKARGNTTTDGVKTGPLSARYFWMKATNGSFSIVVVIADTDMNVTVSNPALASKKFVYHRLDLAENVRYCSSYGRLSTKEFSVVKLTDAAFTKIQYYADDDVRETVLSDTAYMESKTPHTYDRLKLITKQMVAISEELEKIWMNRKELDDFVVWRYYGDYYGHIRIYPGVALPKEYDHTKRSFFSKTVSNGDVITITSPYLDAFGAGVVSSILIPIFIQRDTPVILGVLALDIKMHYIKYLMELALPDCMDDNKICFLMDNSGYLVYHSEVSYKGDNKVEEVYSYHITEQEPAISVYLIKKDYLTSEHCEDLGYKKQLRTWRVNLENSIRHYEKSPNFELVKVTGTNVFIGKKTKKNGDSFGQSCTCANRNRRDYGKSLYQCEKNGNPCTCPCVIDVDYDYCRNRFLHVADGKPACVPQPPSIGFKSPVPDEKELLHILPECYHLNCSLFKTESLCMALPRCRWCAETSQCVNDICPSIPGFNNQTIIIGSAVGMVVLIILVVLTVFYLRKKRTLSSCTNDRQPKPGDFHPHLQESLSRLGSYQEDISK